MKKIKLRSHFLCTLLLLVFFSSCDEVKKYKVEITFCDNRPKKVVIVNSVFEPNNSHIITYETAVPKWDDYLNVCEIRVIE